MAERAPATVGLIVGKRGFHHICEQGCSAVCEALERYVGWQVYYHCE